MVAATASNSATAERAADQRDAPAWATGKRDAARRGRSR